MASWVANGTSVFFQAPTIGRRYRVAIPLPATPIATRAGTQPAAISLATS